MSILNWVSILLFVFCLLMFAYVRIALPKFNLTKLINTKLNDALAEKTFIVAIVFSFVLFMGIYLITKNLFFILLSQLMTIKISRGFNLYKNWLAEKNAHNWKQLFIHLLFNVLKSK